MTTDQRFVDMRELAHSIAVGVLAVCLVWLGVLAMTGQAEAANASNKTTVSFGGDRLYNYDFLSQNHYYGQSHNVDWAVTMIFYNNAEVDKVKSWGYSGFVSCGGSKYGRFKDGSSYEWDSDRGVKSRCDLIGDVYHMRVYGDENDRMYNTTFGYWVFATTHVDHNENLWGEWFGESELAEHHWRDRISAVRGWSYSNDSWNMYNNEPYRAEGNHRWNNNQWATTFSVP